MTQQFRVVISGRTLSGVPLADLKEDVGRAFRLQGEQLDLMLTGQPVVVSRSASGEAAEKLLTRLQLLGLEARIEPLPETLKVEPVTPKTEELFALAAPTATPVSMPPSPPPPVQTPSPVTSATAEVPPVQVPVASEVVCPKCGELQPKRTLCRKCGLDMPRYEQAQAVLEQEAREERLIRLEAARESRGGKGNGAERQAGLLGMGFSGRLGRLDYFSGSLFSTIIWLVFVLLAASTGKIQFVGLGLLLSAIYFMRCVALRLHDTGRTGWLALVALVPFLGALMTLVLLFIHGDDSDNEYGPPPAEGGGRRAILVLLAVFLVSGVTFRYISQSPEKTGRFVEAMGGVDVEEDDDEALDDSAPVHYSRSNRIDLYVAAGCTSCDQMRSWFDTNGLRYTVYSVDGDQHAAERLQSMVGEGRVMLPVLEINGKVLPGDPGIDAVRRHLRQD